MPYMKPSNHKLLTAFVVLALSAPSICAKTYTLSSPDKCINVTLDNTDGILTYSVDRNGKLLVAPSQLDLDINGGPENITVTKHNLKRDITETIDAPLYRQKNFKVTYNQLDMKLNGDRGITFRAYDDGVAYRFYTTSKKDELIINDETIQISLPEDLIL